MCPQASEPQQAARHATAAENMTWARVSLPTLPLTTFPSYTSSSPPQQPLQGPTPALTHHPFPADFKQHPLQPFTST
eukprot:NODE_378_length_1418_cov_349.857560_g278_i0.p4 GENE.NODE_378_length_1418_cov_349.857560_g278_i0~~NODE_378_length_1418_cov_349.857560_g278_i0.p4  ORF type:complete len:77 (+),score=2.14 NODE_378_length_1418_cov_349.857560_g278_i0:139-369(+)